MNEHEKTRRHTRPASTQPGQEDLPPQTSSQEILEQARGFSRAARDAHQNIQVGADALDELRKRAQGGGQ